MKMAVSTEAKVAPWKREVVDDLVETFGHYPVVGILDITDLPSSQFQQIRRQLRGQAEIKVVRKTLLKRSIEQAAQKDPKLRELLAHVRGQPALIFTHMNPFKLSKALDASKTSAPAKPGSSSPKDVVIPAGETSFAPGPIVGELQRVGIKARIQAGKVVILEDCQLLKQGDVITKEVADVLARFGIEPLELGLKLCAAYEGGVIFPAEVLAIDEKRVLGELRVACLSALNLSINTNYPTSATVGILVARASVGARNLALNVCLPATEVMPELLAQANAQMLGLAAALLAKDEKALDEDLKSRLVVAPPAKAEEKKPKEEKPKEKPEEKPKEEEKIEGLGALFGS
jgi:large subunit ribosomal protein L10